jgi:SAM-dependent methyltransferase
MEAKGAYDGEPGEAFAARATDGVYNAHTDRHAMLELAGQVSGLHVLDLGCGAGHYAAEFLARGAAHVVGVDGSETLLRAAQERLGAPQLLADDAGEILGELLQAGFLLERLTEPRATETARLKDPRRWAKTHEVPFFLAVRLHRP